MPRNAGKSELGLFFRFPLACAPRGSAPPWQDESVIERITAAQRENLESEITGLQTKAGQAAEEAGELAGEVPF